jgi:MOSC domain-containing protein YiiM
LRQVHLIPKEVLDQFYVGPGQIGENVTTIGIDLLSLGAGTKLHFVPDGDVEEPSHPVVVVQGLRNPCPQINKFRKGLQEKFIERDESRTIVGRKAGVMGTVEVGGNVAVGMKIVIEKPREFEALKCV